MFLYISDPESKITNVEIADESGYLSTLKVYLHKSELMSFGTKMPDFCLQSLLKILNM